MLCIDIGIKYIDYMQLISSYPPVQHLVFAFICVENPCIGLLCYRDGEGPIVFAYMQDHCIVGFLLDFVHLIIGPDEFFTSCPVGCFIAGRYQFPAPGTQNSKHFFFIICPDCGNEGLHRLFSRGKSPLHYICGNRI